MDTLALLELKSQVEDSKTLDPDNPRTTTSVVMLNLIGPQPLLLIHQLLLLVMNIQFLKIHLNCLPDPLEASPSLILENMDLFRQMNQHPDLSLPMLLLIPLQLTLQPPQPISHLIHPQLPDHNILLLQPDPLTLQPQPDPNILQPQPDPNILQPQPGLLIHQLPVDLILQLLPDPLIPQQPADPTLRPQPGPLILQPLADLTLQRLPDLFIKNKPMILKGDIATLSLKTHWYCRKEDHLTILLPDPLTPRQHEDLLISQLLLPNPHTHLPLEDPNILQPQPDLPTHPLQGDPNIPQPQPDQLILLPQEGPNTSPPLEDLNILQPQLDPNILQLQLDPNILQLPEDLLMLLPPPDLPIPQPPDDPNILPLPEDHLILPAQQLPMKKSVTAILFQLTHWCCQRENQRADLALTTNQTRANSSLLKSNTVASSLLMFLIVLHLVPVIRNQPIKLLLFPLRLNTDSSHLTMNCPLQADHLIMSKEELLLPIKPQEISTLHNSNLTDLTTLTKLTQDFSHLSLKLFQTFTPQPLLPTSQLSLLPNQLPLLLLLTLKILTKVQEEANLSDPLKLPQ